jgi:hypothetical protein
MFRSFHFFYPFLGESLPTIFENGLVIHKDKESFLVVPLLVLKMTKDLSEIAGWLSPTKKEMGFLGVRFFFFSYDISSWMKRVLLNEASPYNSRVKKVSSSF